MSDSKATIQSKRYKMLEKRGFKHAKNYIYVRSSDEEPLPERIEKRRPNNGSSLQQRPYESAVAVYVRNKGFKFNYFNLQRLKKVPSAVYYTYLSAVESAVYLKVVESEDIVSDSKGNRELIAYKVYGSNTIKYVSGLYLSTRLAQIVETYNQPSKIFELYTVSEKPYYPTEGVEVVTVESRPLCRYFDVEEYDVTEQRMVKCYRCNKRGHIAKNCLYYMYKQRCLFCLGEHHHTDCNSRSCFKCNELGHVAQECKAVGGLCHKCHKKGHIERNCGVITFLDFKRQVSFREIKYKYDEGDLKRLTCLAGCKYPNGHFNCFVSSGKCLQPYETERRRYKKL